MTIDSQTNSYSQIIRDGAIERIGLMSFFDTFKKFSRSPQLPIQSQNIPYVGVYVVDDNFVPDGDLNAGEIKFTHTFRLGFSVFILNNNPDEMEDKLDEAYWAIMNGLLRDPTFINFTQSHLIDKTAIEGISKGTRRNIYGNAVKENEMPIAEMRLELSMTYRTNWPPIINDNLETIHVTTGFPLGGTAEDQAKVQQVVAEYDLVPDDA